MSTVNECYLKGVRSAVEFTSRQIRTDMWAVYLACRYSRLVKTKQQTRQPVKKLPHNNVKSLYLYISTIKQ